MNDNLYDAIIIGGGPAGLSAALVLGRCTRRVLLVDAGRPRNRHATEIHGYLTRDCTTPADFRAMAHAELGPYAVECVRGEATHAERGADGTFVVDVERIPSELAGALPCPTRSHGAEERASCDEPMERAPGEPRAEAPALEARFRARGRKLLLATGMADLLPTIPGFERFYGTSIHHCPHCDGWEHRGKRLVAYGIGDAAVGLAIMLRTWSEHVTACTEGAPVREELRKQAESCGIQIRSERVLRLEGDELARGHRIAEGGQLRRIVLSAEGGVPRARSVSDARSSRGVQLATGAAHAEDGMIHDGALVVARGGPVASVGEIALECDAMFFNTGQVQRSDLPRLLGCRIDEHGGVVTTAKQRTGVPGLFLAGDADRDVQFAIVAAAEGATAAVAMNREMQDEERACGVSGEAPEVEGQSAAHIGRG